MTRFAWRDFSWKPYIDQSLTTDRDADIKALGYVKASGATALYSSLSQMANYMRENAKYKSRVILLLSDGEDNASSIKLSQLQQEMEQPGTPVVHLLRVPSPSPSADQRHEQRSEEKDALEMEKMLGGFAYFPRATWLIFRLALNTKNAALRSRYLLTYESGNSSKDGSERRVDLELDKAHQKRQAVLRTPEGYYAPAN